MRPATPNLIEIRFLAGVFHDLAKRGSASHGPLGGGVDRCGVALDFAIGFSPGRVESRRTARSEVGSTSGSRCETRTVSPLGGGGQVGATDLDVGFDVVPLRVVVEDTGTDENGRPRLSVRYLRPNESAFPTAKYWIGVRAEAATAALRAQLRLPEDQGVVVGEVMPDSPAQKAV